MLLKNIFHQSNLFRENWQQIAETSDFLICAFSLSHPFDILQNEFSHKVFVISLWLLFDDFEALSKFLLVNLASLKENDLNQVEIHFLKGNRLKAIIVWVAIIVVQKISVILSLNLDDSRTHVDEFNNFLMIVSLDQSKFKGFVDKMRKLFIEYWGLYLPNFLIIEVLSWLVEVQEVNPNWQELVNFPMVDQRIEDGKNLPEVVFVVLNIEVIESSMIVEPFLGLALEFNNRFIERKCGPYFHELFQLSIIDSLFWYQMFVQLKLDRLQKQKNIFKVSWLVIVFDLYFVHWNSFSNICDWTDLIVDVFLLHNWLWPLFTHLPWLKVDLEHFVWLKQQ